jgi:2,3-bisphosphoglycerate-independent phosphoglycerate mutase
MKKAPIVLIVLDGVGDNKNPKGNAVLAANTPNLDSYYKKYPWTLLDASGEAVGLPAGFQGSSEVGHLSMGAGRIVEQELKRINGKLEDGSLFSNENWQNLIDNWKKNNSQFHFFGLLQDEGVHAHQDHLFKLMKRARQEFPEGKIVIHSFLDGRDTPPRSTLEYFYTLRKEMEKIGNCQIGTIMGRYYGMDRVKSWDLTDQAYHCIVDAIGKKAAEPETAIKESYENDKTPSGADMFDEYIEPYVINGYSGVADGDVIRNQIRTSGERPTPYPLGYDRYTGQTFGNKEFILNAMNYLIDESGLISIRSRELKLRLLDRTKITDNKLFWQLLNTVLPVVLIIILGVVMFIIRKRKYT